MKAIHWPYMIVLLPLFSPMPAWADEAGAAANQDRDQSTLMEMDIEDLRRIKVATVFGASRFEQKVTEAPSSVSIVTAEEIKKYGYRTLADILRSVRGLYATYDRNYSYLGVRGLNRPGDYSTRILLLVDGHRINENIFEQAIIGPEFILDVDLIDRVEIIRGPGSSLYGSNAFFGIINVITKQGRDLTGTEVSGEAGSYDTYKGRMSFGKKFSSGGEAIISGSVYDSKGRKRLYYPEFDSPSMNNGIAENADYENYRSFFTRTSFGDFTLEGALNHREKGIPTASFGTVFNDRRNTVDEHGLLELRHDHVVGQNTVLSRLYYDDFRYYGNYVYPAPDGAYYDSAYGAWWGAEEQVSGTIGGRHKWVAGAEYRANTRQQMVNYFKDPYVPVLDDNRRSTIWAVYAQDEVRLADKLLTSIGVRHDHYQSFGGTTNPRLALIYQLRERSTMKLLYGQAFRAPGDYERYYQDNGFSQKANPDLKPEKNRTTELVYEQYAGDHLWFSLTGYHYSIDDLITLVTDPTDTLSQFRNVQAVQTNGAEVELGGRWPRGQEFVASYAFQRAVDQQTKEILTNSPLHLAQLRASAPLSGEKLFGGFDAQYMGRRKTLAGNYAHAFTIVNVTLFSHAVMKDLDLSATVYNVFDRQYGDPGAGIPQHAQDIIEQDGRTYRVKLTYRF